MIKNLKVHVYNTSDDAKPETIVTIPLSTLHIAVQLLPKKVRLLLEKEGIDIGQCRELVNEKDLRGNIIEVESRTKKLVISVE